MGEPATAKLELVRSGDGTVVRAALQAGPLRFLTPRNHGNGAWVYTTTLGGGLVDGDQLRLSIDVGAGATALVSSMGSLRVYRSPRGSTSHTEARVADGGFLALLPDPTSCFAGARCDQRLTVELAAGGSLLVADTLTSGRAAHGERWAFSRWSNVLEVRAAGRTLLRDALLLDPAHGPLAARLGRFDALATLLLLGPALREHAAALRAAIDQSPPGKRAALLEAVSPAADGVLVRIAGESVEAVTRQVQLRLSFLPPLLGDDPWARRF